MIQGLLRIKSNKQKILVLGNLYSRRDWGHASDYVNSMWKILNKTKPDDYVIATNKSYSVKDFINIAKKIGFKIRWKGKGLNEVGVDSTTNKTIIRVDKKYFRETEVDNLIGNYKKAKNLKLEAKFSLNNLIDDMIKNEI